MNIIDILARSFLVRETLTRINDGKKGAKAEEREINKLKNKLNSCAKTIKYTKSMSTMVKNFDTIKTSLKSLIKITSEFYFEIAGKIINNINDIYLIDIIKQEWIKDFIERRIELELEIIGYLTQPFLKEKQVRKALNIAIKAIEFLPDDLDLQERISDLENKLIECYEED